MEPKIKPLFVRAHFIDRFKNQHLEPLNVGHVLQHNLALLRGINLAVTTASTSTWDAFSVQKLSAPAPHLRHLQIECIPTYFGSPPQVLTLPESFPGDDCPLETVILNYISPQFLVNRTDFPNLRVLDLSLFMSVSSFGPAEVLHLIAASPQLAQLSIEWKSPILHTPVATLLTPLFPEIVEASALENISLRNWHEDHLAPFLSYIQLPSIKNFNSSIRPSSTHFPFHYLGSIPHEVGLLHSSAPSARIGYEQDSISVAFYPEKYHASFKNPVVSYASHAPFARSSLSFASSFAFDSCTNLAVHASNRIPRDDGGLCNLLSQFPSLQSLRLGGSLVPLFLTNHPDIVYNISADWKVLELVASYDDFGEDLAFFAQKILQESSRDRTHRKPRILNIFCKSDEIRAQLSGKIIAQLGRSIDYVEIHDSLP
ncbi:hypothetical protein SISNIDRAFT_267637 [Sistotremastrum niveocremeum HHB9708]|uniref:F-box domain-containing protein n=2 Tax=Sistotremastraceae TaxID=3402574 RepID=A0A164NYT4_9AGAM|nr:hypothetical protein SISNIDRAFT_267637 [Sistotremastrum niveocremeum HHB9708]KZT36505.1 hypothetical protein SISSUDRAFT_1063587 [Sistotremastrum suecicum HHB10207 ss-3]